MRKAFFVLLFITSLFLAAFSAYQINLKEHFRSLVPHLTPGEAVPAGSFMNDGDQPITLRDHEDKPILLFVFERPCSTCTPSITFWMKLSELASKRAHIMGIIQDRVEMIRIAGTKRLPFQLISPVDGDEFLQGWRLRLNLAQTIILKGNRVEYVRLGNLGGADMQEIMRKLHEREEK
ncbi:MAG: redoxin family protein [Bacteroidales bacterium]|jgi:peroxiredoxin|nr:redoxin family protein [Bacteroidales bacterium]